MSRTEWKTFQNELFTAFPGFGEYVSDRSPNPSGTLETWFKTLADVTYDEAKSVLDGWLSGNVEHPKAFEKDFIAILIKSRVGFKRSEQQRYSTAKSLYEEKQAVAKQRFEYQPLFSDLEKAYEIASEAYGRVKLGEISLEEYNQICMEAIK